MFEAILKHKHTINRSIQVLITLLLLFALYREIFLNEDIESILGGYVEALHGGNIIYLFLTIIFMPVNWLLESFKWQLLISKIEKISFLRAINGILGGITFSIFTPNRVGEFIGRVAVLQPGHKIKGVFLTLVGSFSQILAALTLGILGLLYFMWLHLGQEWYSVLAAAVIGGVVMTLLILIYFNVSIIHEWMEKIKFLKRFSKYTTVLKFFNIKELWTYYFLSLLRYSVFTLQYLFMMKLFGINFELFDGFMIICLVFFIHTIIPSIAIIELGIRGQIAFYLFQEVNVDNINELATLSASFGIWMINLIIPAIIGAIIIYWIRFFK
ncbi:MAG: flippase-like domain-containing protein [Bacteroidetes bacterium]|nr:flippase-like domain-containing protein [Bacteroidota bacterium]